MSGVRAVLDAALAKMINRETGHEVLRVFDIYDSTRTAGLCNTCQYEQVVVEVTYVTYSRGSEVSRTWLYEGRFGELVNALDRE